MVRALAQGTVAGLLAWGAAAVRTGRVDVADYGPDGSAVAIETAAAIVMVLAVLLLLYSLVRMVVGGIDLVTRVTVDGTVVSVDERLHGDVLPGFVQDLIWSRGDRIDSRRARLQLVLETSSGRRTWLVSPKQAASLQAGRHIRLTVTPLIGRVMAITPASGRGVVDDTMKGTTR